MVIKLLIMCGLCGYFSLSLIEASQIVPPVSLSNTFASEPYSKFKHTI